MTTMQQKHEERIRKARELAKQPLTQEEKTRWARMFHQTWHAIGNDIEHAAEEGHLKITKSLICETVCDANYVQMYGGMTDEEYEFVCNIYDRPVFKRWLMKEMNYA